MNKIIGYILTGIGIVCLAISGVPFIRKLFSFIPKSILAGPYFLIGSLALIVIGVVLLAFNSRNSKQPKEVPIYDKEGKTIVGYRRMAEK
ncbi:MAG: hypothetical protein AABX07_06170 [Nanoarchaeota archaeon]